jgi:hypothetical protein
LNKTFPKQKNKKIIDKSFSDFNRKLKAILFKKEKRKIFITFERKSE